MNAKFNTIGTAWFAIVEHMNEESVGPSTVHFGHATKVSFPAVRCVHPIDRRALKVLKTLMVLELKISSNIAVSEDLSDKAHRVLSTVELIPTASSDVPCSVGTDCAHECNRLRG